MKWLGSLVRARVDQKFSSVLASIHAEVKQFGSIKTEPGILKGASARPLLDEVTNQFPTHERVLGQERTQELKQATVQLTILLVKAWLKREPLPKDHLQWVKNVCGVFGMTAEQKDISSALVEYQSTNTMERLRVAATAAMTSVNEVSFFQSSYEATVSVQKDDDTWKRICEGFSNLLDQLAERATTPTSTQESLSPWVTFITTLSKDDKVAYHRKDHELAVHTKRFLQVVTTVIETNAAAQELLHARKDHINDITQQSRALVGLRRACNNMIEQRASLERRDDQWMGKALLLTSMSLANSEMKHVDGLGGREKGS